MSAPEFSEVLERHDTVDDLRGKRGRPPPA